MRDFLKSNAGKYAAYTLSVSGMLMLGWIVFAWTGDNPAARSADRIFIDADTGEQFGYELVKNETIPVPSPHSGGKRVGYEAEPCYWTAEGTPRSEPVWVLPMTKVDPEAGPTFCDDCGRLVVARNPEPVPGARPPPTRDEYKPPARARGATGPDEYYPGSGM